MVKIKLLEYNGGFPEGTIVVGTHRIGIAYTFINIDGEEDTVWVVEDESNPDNESWAGVIVNEETTIEVEHPSHYNTVEGMPEVWDILDAFFPDDPTLWNAGKYLLRAGRKNSKVEDLKKLVQYAQRAIEKEELHG